MSNFMQETLTMTGFDMYDVFTCLGCFFGELKLTRTAGKYLMTYELEYENTRVTFMQPLKYADLDEMLYEVFERMFGYGESDGCNYYDPCYV